MFACTPGSLKLGDDTETLTEEGSDGTDSVTTGGTGGPGTTGEPAPEGVLEWDELLDDTTAYAMAVGPDGTIVVIGEKGFTPQGDGGIYASRWMGKFSPGGEQVWLHETVNSEESYPSPQSVSVGPGGEIFVGSVDYSAPGGLGNAVTRHTPGGEEVWSVVVPARAFTVRATPEGGVIAGGTTSVDENNSVGWARALDADGATLWDNDYPGVDGGFARVRSIAVVGDDIVLAGNTSVPPDGGSAAWLHRAARASGAEVWDQTVSAATTTDWVEHVAATADGTIVALVAGDGLRTVRAYGPAGAELWSFTPELVEEAAALAVASDGSFTVTDGKYIPFDEPGFCQDGFSPCPVSMRVERRAADRSLLWEVASETCQAGLLAEAMPGDGVVVFAHCSTEPGGDLRGGLLRYAP